MRLLGFVSMFRGTMQSRLSMDCPLKVMTMLPLSNVVSALVRGRGLTFVTCDRYSIRGYIREWFQAFGEFGS